jgi:hypothetical protein
MVRLVLFTTAIAAVMFGADQLADPWVHPLAWWVLAFYFVLTVLGERLIQKGIRQNRDNFMGTYMAVIGIRFLLSAVFIGIFIYRRTPDLRIFVTNFFVLYLLFLGFEIWGVLGNLRRDSPGAS